jgi:LVIVD repeat
MIRKILMLLLVASLLCCSIFSTAQNVGIGTTTPLQKLHVQGNTYIRDSLGVGIDTARATLHVNGTFRLKQGVVVNQVSSDSNFFPGSDSILPTQKAIKRYIQKGSWASPAGYSDSLLVWKNSSTANLYGPQSVFVQGNYAYVASFDNNQLCIYNISNPEQIVPMGVTSTNIWGPTFVYVKGNYAYVTSYYNSNLSIYDISDPNTIVPKAFTPSNLYAPYSVMVQGNYAYVQYQPGDMIMVDFAGKKQHYVDVQTGERIECQVFVAVLPYSGLIFCKAVPSQQTADFTSCINAMLKYYAGVPATILCDNLKTSLLIGRDILKSRMNR